jgi:4-hydroxythreonine-4-phosphate dehydrogenase
MKPVIAITAGDVNGVGYEVIMKSLIHPHICEICRPVVYGNAKVARKHAQTLDEEYRNIQWNVINDPKQAKDGRLNLITCYSDDTSVELGQATAEGGKTALMSLQRACKDLKNGSVHAIVTAPINKDNIQSEQFHYSGHTEYLTQYFGEGKDSLMMMISESMRVALVCNHTPIAQVSQQITQENILKKLSILNETLQNDFSCSKPRIAILALNPHAGDNGLIGKEEEEVIRPTVAAANEQGICVCGPYSADGFFGAGHYSSFDAVLAMYHDQGLAPFKALDMSGVNFTAGLPVLRTSPDHGTAYGIAGKNQADATSMLHAIYTAIDVLKTRKQNKELTANQLVVEVKEEKREHRIEKFVPFD